MTNFLDSRHPSAEDILSALLAARPEPTRDAPKDRRGIYGLVDHDGDLRYIGSTKATAETFYKRIHQRHRTGSENSSHYFSRMYNAGRMWRLRNDPATKVDGDIAKKLRNAFVAEYCKAVWVPLPESADIAGLEQAVIRLAPKAAIAWNGRSMEAYAEPVELVDRVLLRLKFGPSELEAVNRQNTRFLGSETAPVAISSANRSSAPVTHKVPPFPKGPFRFFALDVETANNDRGSICQIGVACVRPDNSIETWVTYVDPQTNTWVFTYLHGIEKNTVFGAPLFEEVLPVLNRALHKHVVYQHSAFDRSAITAACHGAGLVTPVWNWKDSVHVARRTWPELKGNGGHGLGSLKTFLGLSFEHHDAGEDARAAAEVVLRAEGHQTASGSASTIRGEEYFEVIERITFTTPTSVVENSEQETPTKAEASKSQIGTTIITQGNINNNHIYLRNFFAAFPSDAIGGSSSATSAPRTIAVDWGGQSPAVTDLDGKKMFFRKRSWVREFFKKNGVLAGDTVAVEVVAPYHYSISVVQVGHK